jgi:hypothetical protein
VRGRDGCSRCTSDKIIGFHDAWLQGPWNIARKDASDPIDSLIHYPKVYDTRATVHGKGLRELSWKQWPHQSCSSSGDEYCSLLTNYIIFSSISTLKSA